MADLTQELALLNQQAAELLQKYDQTFTRLDEKSQELAQQLVNQINDGLSQLQQKTNDGITQLVAKIQEGLNQLQTIIETGAFPKVVSKPTIIGSTTAAIGHETSWTVSAESYLDDNVHIDHFEINWGDGNTETVSATENQAQISHAFSGNVGDSFQISVVAVDFLGNKSEPATLEVQLVDNQPPDISGMQITGFSVDSDGNPYLIGGYSKQISISGAEDPEGQKVFYDITDSGILIPSKTQNLADGELIDIQAPSVEQDTTTALKVLAKDEMGLVSPVKTFNVIVKKVEFGIADIFGDGSCVVYMPLKQSFEDLTGNTQWGYPDPLNEWNNSNHPEPVPYFDSSLGFYNNASGGTCAAHLILTGGNSELVKKNGTYKYLDLGTNYAVSVQIKPRYIYPFTLVEQGNYGESATNGIALGLDFKPSSDNTKLICQIIGSAGNDSSVTTENSGFNWSGYAGSQVVIDPNEITTLTFSRDGTKVDFYVNGNLHWSHNFSDSSVNLPFHLYSIIGNSGGCFDYAGYLKNVRIFRRPLDDDEAQILANES